MKNTCTTCSCLHACGVLHSSCSSETRKACLVSLSYCQRGHHYADSVVHWSLFGAHTEVMQWELQSMEILFHSLPYRRWTMENLLIEWLKWKAIRVHTAQKTWKRKLQEGGKKKRHWLLTPTALSPNFVHYNLDFAFVLVIEYALWSDPIAVTLLEFASTADASLCCIIKGDVLIVTFQRHCSSWFK